MFAGQEHRSGPRSSVAHYGPLKNSIVLQARYSQAAQTLQWPQPIA